ncbi:MULTISPECIES: 3-hydroxyacyl-CoA dehydrogenase NAD-binding domain-containing protein [Jannaschia]|nr:MULTISPECIES: 3-hydroxyacyl-CoA dehydrogenase NAD-binding domain-containing protein [unclassified Jannaschia]
MTVSLHHDGACAIVTIDAPPVNAISQTVRQGLLDAVAACDANPEVQSVVLTCAGRTFVAGADIREFGAPPQPPHLPDVVTAIEGATKPWVAAIHGMALGGGLELALGCHGRVATAEAKLGLPEVTLGLIPGAGGTVRLPRLVPAEMALDMVATGKPVTAQAALAAGLIDRTADADLLDAAKSLATTLGQPTPTLSRAPAPITEAFEAKAKSLLSKARGQLSIPEAVEAVRRGLGSAPEALVEERAAFLRLKSSDQSGALRHIFFAERSTLKDARAKVPPRPLQSVGVVGGGTMGAGIAAACLLSGLSVTMVERDAEAAALGHTRVEGILSQSRARGLLSDGQYDDRLSAFRAVADYAALGEADLAIEAVFEDLDVKHGVFAQLDRHMRAGAVLATNTSYLDVDQIAAATRDPSRVIGLHFFSPAHIMKLLEIVTPAAVADDVVATAVALSKRLGKTAVLAGVCDGFVANRIMTAYRREADYLLEEGALPWQVDGAMRDYGFPMGVFQMQDLAGLDIAWAMRKRRAATRPDTERYVTIADSLCKAGRFGRKAGAGWYAYDGGAPRPDPEVVRIIGTARAASGRTPRTFGDPEIMDRILGAMTREAQAVLAEGIARTPEDIDVVMVNGFSFPRWRGGPMYAAGITSA